MTRYTDEVRQYVWDPDGSHGFQLDGTPDSDALAPDDATDTGYRLGDVALWIAVSDADRYVYLQQSDGSYQRWPRSPKPIGCA